MLDCTSQKCLKYEGFRKNYFIFVQECSYKKLQVVFQRHTHVFVICIISNYIVNISLWIEHQLFNKHSGVLKYSKNTNCNPFILISSFKLNVQRKSRISLESNLNYCTITVILIFLHFWLFCWPFVAYQFKHIFFIQNTTWKLLLSLKVNSYRPRNKNGTYINKN